MKIYCYLYVSMRNDIATSFHRSVQLCNLVDNFIHMASVSMSGSEEGIDAITFFLLDH
jgi:hypothetical protein